MSASPWDISQMHTGAMGSGFPCDTLFTLTPNGYGGGDRALHLLLPCSRTGELVVEGVGGDRYPASHPLQQLGGLHSHALTPILLP